MGSYLKKYFLTSKNLNINLSSFIHIRKKNPGAIFIISSVKHMIRGHVQIQTLKLHQSQEHLHIEYSYIYAVLTQNTLKHNFVSKKLVLDIFLHWRLFDTLKNCHSLQTQNMSKKSPNQQYVKKVSLTDKKKFAFI